MRRSARHGKLNTALRGWRRWLGLALAMPMFNLLLLQSSPADDLLQMRHKQGDCCCVTADVPAPETHPETHPVTGAACTLLDQVDSCCSGEPPAPPATPVVEAPEASTDCCDDVGSTCKCRPVVPAINALLCVTTTLPLPLNCPQSQPALRLWIGDGGMAPPEQPPRA